MEPWQIIFIIILAILLFLLFIGSVILFIVMRNIYRDIFYSAPRDANEEKLELDFNGVSAPELAPLLNKLFKEAINLPQEDLYVTSYDNLKLHGVLYRFSDKNAPLAICFHGYKGNKYRDFMGALKIYEDLKYNVILVDQRSQGRSEGHQITFGVKESKDVITWINKAKEIFSDDVKISIEGLSMGGATVLFAACNPLPSNVKCVVADCPFTSCHRIFEYSLRNVKVPKFMIRFTSYLIGKFYMKLNFNKYDALKNLKNNQIPILLIHGEKDSIIPHTESLDLQSKYPNLIQVETFKNSEHGMSYFEDTQRYWEISKTFLKKYLEK